MSRLWFFPGLMLLALLAGCAAPAASVTSFQPPGTPGGRLCLAQCNDARDACLDGCNLTERACSNRMQQQAIMDYDKYAREQLLAHQDTELRPRDFERPEQCRQEACHNVCERQYETCYTGCGGKVVTQSSCQFLCF